MIIAIVPGEPLEIGAGYAFGAVEGTLLCILGTTLSSVLIFLVVKKFGMRVVTLFVSEEKIRSFTFLQNTRRLNLIAFLLFFIPGTPKDVLTYVVGLTPMRLPTWVAHHHRGAHPLGYHLHHWQATPWERRITFSRWWCSQPRPLSSAWGCWCTGRLPSTTRKRWQEREAAEKARPQRPGWLRCIKP